MRRSITFSLTSLLLVPRFAQAAVQVDLATSPPELSVWGRTDDQVGRATAVADFNGDGILDLAISEPGALAVCLYWGAFALPIEMDREISTPPTCMDWGLIRNRGYTLDTADFDGDGIADLVLGDPVGGVDNSGVISVFRGRLRWPTQVSGNDADWTFVGRDRDDQLQFGIGGDLNGDGNTDIVLFSPAAWGPSNMRRQSGEAYIFFGPTTSWKPVTDLALEASDVIVYGADGLGSGRSGDHIGILGGAVITNLVGDSIPDLIFASDHAYGAAEDKPNAGEVYVLRGRPVWPPVIDLRNPGSTDFIVYGPRMNSQLTWPAVGDVDGDGTPDLVIGARTDSAGSGRLAPGALYIFRGGALSGSRDLATSFADATIVGANDWANIGFEGAIGDVNGDGFADIITGGPRDSPLGRTSAGAISVLSGCDGFPRSRDLATDPADLVFLGALYADSIGEQLAVGDVDGDGKTDIFFGNHRTSSLDGLRPDGGEAHLVLGRPFDAVCTISPDAGPAVDLCGVADVTLDGSRSLTTGCSVTTQYRWLEGTTIVRDWASAPTTVVRPTATTSYRLEVRCGDCAGPCFAATTVDVTVALDIPPPTLDNTLKAVRNGGDVAMEWGTVAEARSYSVFRGLAKETWPLAPWVEDLTTATTTLPDVPAPPNDALYFYRAAGASCSGVEGS